MKFRCPHCRHTFAPDGKSRCPGCGRTVLLPGFFGKSESMQAGEIARRARDRSANPGIKAKLPFGRPGRLLIAMAVMLAIAVLLLRRVNMGPAPTDLHRVYVTQDNLAVLRAALDQFRNDCGHYPSLSEGLISLIHDPGATGWQGPYIFELKPDPWGRAFVFSVESSRCLLRSLGPDGTPDTPDDIHLAWAVGQTQEVERGLFPAAIGDPRARASGSE